MLVKKMSFIFVFLSGFTGLIYQVVWQRFLSQLLGSDSLATSLVLALFFFFTALGYEVLGRKVFSWMKNKLLLYGILEAFIGIYAFISPAFFRFIENLSLGSSFFSQIILSSLFISLPTFLMGGTLPLLTQGLSNSFKNSHITHAYLYALNGFGAVFGCLFTGFYLIEQFGLNYSLFLAGQINLLMLPLIYLACRFKPSQKYEGFLPEKSSSSRKNLKRKKENLKVQKKSQKKSLFPSPIFLFSKEKSLYIISFLSGFYVFSIETLFIRITGTIIGSSVYSYSMIVACFIFALALGALVVTLFKRLQKLSFLLFFQGLTFLSFYLLYLSLSYWPDLLHRIRLLVLPSEANFIFYWMFIFFTLTSFLILPVCFMGLGLPILFGFLKNKAQALSPVVGRLYGINAVGCALGSLIGGYFLLYFFEVKGLFQMNLYLMLFNFLLLSLLCFPKKAKAFWFGKGFLAFFLIATFFLPHWDESKMAPGAFNYVLNPKEVNNYFQSMKEKRKVKKIIYSNFGPNTYTHVTEEKDKSRTLYVNGKADANTKGDHNVRSLNILIPLLLSPRPKDIFIVGLGTGKSTQLAASFKETQAIEVSEISHSVGKALPYFEEYTQGLKLIKSKEKSSDFNQKWDLLIGDAYRILKLKKNKKYDLIVSEPSNPWVIGVEKIFSLEFLSLVKTHLNKRGIYSQWVPLFGMNSSSLLKILNNFNSIFPWTYVWATSSSTLLIFGTLSPLEVNLEKMKSRFKEQKDLFRSIGFYDPFSILGLQILTPLTTKALTKGYKKWHTQSFPKLAYEAGRAKFSGQIVDVEHLLFLRNLKTKIFSSKVFKRVPKNAKHLLFQNLSSVSSNPSFYQNTLDFMKSNGWAGKNQLQFHQNKMKFLFRKHLGAKQAKKYVSEEVFKIYAYLSGLSASPQKPDFKMKIKRKTASVDPKSKEKLLLKMEKIIEAKAFQWIRIYKNLIIMGAPRSWARLNSMVPKDCSRKLCLKIKKEIKKLKD